jgi:hypothetical protein
VARSAAGAIPFGDVRVGAQALFRRFSGQPVAFGASRRQLLRERSAFSDSAIAFGDERIGALALFRSLSKQNLPFAARPDRLRSRLRYVVFEIDEDPAEKPGRFFELRLHGAKLETSRAQTAPTFPRQTSATIRSKPARCTPPAAERPRSSSITSISMKPSAVSRSRMAYGNAPLSRLCSTWWAEDWRT